MNGQPVELYKDYQINMLGAGYNCPALNLYGYRTIASLKRMITKRIRTRAEQIFPEAFSKGARR